MICDTAATMPIIKRMGVPAIIMSNQCLHGNDRWTMPNDASDLPEVMTRPASMPGILSSGEAYPISCTVRYFRLLILCIGKKTEVNSKIPASACMVMSGTHLFCFLG